MIIFKNVFGSKDTITWSKKLKVGYKQTTQNYVRKYGKKYGWMDGYWLALQGVQGGITDVFMS